MQASRFSTQDSTPDTPVLEFRGVSLTFDDRVILDNVSFKVMPGEMRILLGPVGCGKSTLLKLATGLLKPDAGRILLFGEDITELEESQMIRLRRELGIVFQTDALFTSLSVAENVAYRLTEEGHSIEELEGAIKRTLRLVGLERAFDKMPHELSGGMMRRVALARALVGQPKMIFFDSPTSGLDPVIGGQICRLAMKLRDLYRISILYVTQNLHEVRYLCSAFYDRLPGGAVRLYREEGGSAFEPRLPAGEEGVESFCVINTKIIMLEDGLIIHESTDEEFWLAANPAVCQFIGLGIR